MISFWERFIAASEAEFPVGQNLAEFDPVEFVLPNLLTFGYNEVTPR